MAYPVPVDEEARLAALRDLAILDTPPEQSYDDLVRLAAALCRAPIAMVNLVDADRQWGKAVLGLESCEASREASFCARTILAEDGLLVVTDALEDPEWASSAQVAGCPSLRFYAGAAIVTAGGHALGSVCVADRAPRGIDREALEALRILSRQAAAHLELRAMATRLVEAGGALRRLTVFDPLTGLANRALLLDRLRHELSHRQRAGGHLGVLLCELDGLEAVNDELGRHAGDEALQIVAGRLVEASRGSDTVARVGGDEFAVLCPGLSGPGDLDAIARRLAAAVCGLGRLRIGIGTATAGDGDAAEDVLRRADAALRAARRRGRAPRRAAA